MMMSNYQQELSDNLNRLNNDSNKVSSEKNFTRASQDPIGAMEALKTTRQLASVTQYQQSVTSTTSWMNSAESSVKTVDSILQSSSETLTAAKNGTNNAGDDSNYAASVDSYQQEMLETLNSTFNGQFIFGGNASGNPPFKAGTADDLSGAGADIDTTGGFTSDQVEGKLLYNIPNTSVYIPVSAVNNVTDPTDPNYKYSINNPAMKYTMPVDVGLGMKTDSSGNVASGTAFDASTSALDFLAQNISAGGSTNVYDTLGTVSTQLKAGDNTQLDTPLSLTQSTQDSELKTNVVIGEKSKMLGFLGTQLTSESTNLTTSLSGVEDADVTAAMTNFSMSQMVYQASLQISSDVLQNSLIDFLK
jgi:flagellar hook-associated protein 3 FlgL